MPTGNGAPLKKALQKKVSAARVKTRPYSVSVALDDVYYTMLMAITKEEQRSTSMVLRSLIAREYQRERPAKKTRKKASAGKAA